MFYLLYNSQKEDSETGKCIKINLKNGYKTEIISNKRLASFQRPKTVGGLLEPKDIVIVWAREFLDDKILFETVKNNIMNGIKYFYFLDSVHHPRFKVFLKRLEEQVDKDIVKTGIDVIFIKPELTLNNYVMMGISHHHENFYSSVIFDDQPFGWVRQNYFRGELFIKKIEHITKSLAVAQYIYSINKENTFIDSRLKDSLMFPVENQIIELISTGEKIYQAQPKDLREVSLDIPQIIANTDFPSDALSRYKFLSDTIGEG